MIEYICSFEEEYGFLVSASMKYGEELIRCKDCVKYKIYNDGYCPWIEQEVEEDFFCKDGKRKEE